jgi:hypothetical protein
VSSKQNLLLKTKMMFVFSQDQREIGGRVLGEVSEAAYGRYRGD